MKQELENIHRICKMLEDELSEQQWKLSQLQNRCNHPQSYIVNSESKTYCSLCHKEFSAGKKELSQEELVRIGCEYDTLISRVDILLANLESWRNKCPHPEDKAIHNPEDSWCGVCLKNWWDIQKEQETQNG